MVSYTLDEVNNIFEKAYDSEERCKDCLGCTAHDEGCPNDGSDAIPDALYYLKQIKQSADNKPLSFYELSEMIGEPVFYKDSGCAGFWEIISAVKKTHDNEYVLVKGSDRWMIIGKNFYRRKK